jgi:hypothetical protein
MKVYQEVSLSSFEFWGGAEDVFAMIEEADKVEDLEALLEDCYPNGISDVKLNDFLRHDSDDLFSMLNMEEVENED